MPPEVEVQSLNHWTAREGPGVFFFFNNSFQFFAEILPDFIYFLDSCIQRFLKHVLSFLLVFHLFLFWIFGYSVL